MNAQASDPPTPAAADTATDRAGYIRGGGGVQVKGRQVARVLAACCAVGLAVLVILLSVSAADQNSRINRLRHHGIAVDVTITSCVGMASGTGITASGYRCKGTFTLAGTNFEETIGGTIALRTPGETINAITIAGHPAIIATADNVAAEHPSWKPFITPAVLLLVLIGLLICLVVWRPAVRSRVSDIA